MKRLYMLCLAAMRQDREGNVGIAVSIGYKLAGSGDEVSTFGWEQIKETFPETSGFREHRVMLRTVDNATVSELVEYQNGLALMNALDQEEKLDR